MGHRESAAGFERERSRSVRDIGPIPPIANVKRRRKCERSLRLFCETYNRETFYWPWSDDQRLLLESIQQSITKEALLAAALARGQGKTSICRMGVLWAASYGFVPYAFLIGANEDKAVEGLETIKIWMRMLPEYGEDFPEISVPARALGGIANRASGQLCCGEPTFIRWERNRIVLPRVPKPPNLDWHKGTEAPSSGVVIGVSGLTGDGLRGSLFPHPDGRLIRPKFVLLDDPQTDQSADSQAQNATRENLVLGAVLGMAGPGERMSAIMPCTVIRRGDMADRILDRKRNPLWRGIRTSLLRSMPKNMAAWEEYFAVYKGCMGQVVPDIGPANAHYTEHRSILDEGAESSWPSRKSRDEVSSIQHAMNLYCERGKQVFFAEYQNQPIEDEVSQRKLDYDVLAAKVSGVPRGVVPKDCQHLAAFVDVHGNLLYWLVLAGREGFGCHVVDYGAYPKQPVPYFSQASPPVSMSDVHPGMVDDAYILASLAKLIDSLLSRKFEREDGAITKIEKQLIDCRWGEKTELVKGFCRRHPQHFSVLLPSMGQGFGAKYRPITEYHPEAGAIDGGGRGCPAHWRIGPHKNGDRWVTIDVNFWKSQAARRLSVPLGTPGGWSLFGRDPREHELFFDHCRSERPVQVIAKGRTIDEWELENPGTDNHLWDCLVGAAVGLSWAGVILPGSERPRRKSPSERPSAAQLAGAK